MAIDFGLFLVADFECDYFLSTLVTCPLIISPFSVLGFLKSNAYHNKELFTLSNRDGYPNRSYFWLEVWVRLRVLCRIRFQPGILRHHVRK